MIMRPRCLAACGICFVLQIAGCNSEVPAGDGLRVNFVAACDKANEGKRVSLEGFLDFPDRFNAKASTIVMRFKAAPTRTSNMLGVSVKLNAGTNTIVAPPDKYHEGDLKALTYDGKSAGYRTRLKVTGTVSNPDSLDTREFKCVLKDTRIELAGAVVAQFRRSVG
jgi:hypothetical protein